MVWTVEFETAGHPSVKRACLRSLHACIHTNIHICPKDMDLRSGRSSSPEYSTSIESDVHPESDMALLSKILTAAHLTLFIAPYKVPLPWLAMMLPLMPEELHRRVLI